MIPPSSFAGQSNPSSKSNWSSTSPSTPFSKPSPSSKSSPLSRVWKDRDFAEFGAFILRGLDKGVSKKTLLKQYAAMTEKSEVTINNRYTKYLQTYSVPDYSSSSAVARPRAQSAAAPCVANRNSNPHHEGSSSDDEKVFNIPPKASSKNNGIMVLFGYDFKNMKANGPRGKIEAPWKGKGNGKKGDDKEKGLVLKKRSPEKIDVGVKKGGREGSPIPSKRQKMSGTMVRFGTNGGGQEDPLMIE